MIVCPRCGKENQDHYKFCLGCGAELPRDAAHQPKSFTAPTPPAGFPAKGGAASAPPPVEPPPAAVGGGGGGFGGGGSAQFGGAAASSGPGTAPQPRPMQPPPAAEPATAPLSQGGMLTCPKCGNSVPPNFKFCGSCGHPMAEVQAAAATAAKASSPAPAVGAPPPAVATTKQRGSLVLIRPDGTEGDSFPLADGETHIGRDAGGAFSSDTYLSPRHATFQFQGNELRVRDEDSLNGVYFRVQAEDPHELVDGAIFRIGQEIIRFQLIPPKKKDPDGVEIMGSPDPGFIGRISLVIGRDTYGNAYCVPPEGMHLGRERGDIIFPDDGYVSGLHCRIYSERGKVMLVDVGSSNGTFMRVRGEQQVRSGTLLLMGQQLFRVEY